MLALLPFVDVFSFVFSAADSPGWSGRRATRLVCAPFAPCGMVVPRVVSVANLSFVQSVFVRTAAVRTPFVESSFCSFCAWCEGEEKLWSDFVL